jgi:hypothetical protein
MKETNMTNYERGYRDFASGSAGQSTNPDYVRGYVAAASGPDDGPQGFNPNNRLARYPNGLPEAVDLEPEQPLFGPNLT